MTPEQELSALLERKAKADALPEEIRLKNAKLYTQICVRIAALTRKLNPELAESTATEIVPPFERISSEPDTLVSVSRIFALDIQLAGAIARGDTAETEALSAQWAEAWTHLFSYSVLIENGFTEVQADVTELFGST